MQNDIDIEFMYKGLRTKTKHQENTCLHYNEGIMKVLSTIDICL